MLRMKPIQSANRACLYYEKSDAGYYQGTDGLHCEWGGKDAEKLGLKGEPDYEHFKNLMYGLDPHSGEQLTAKLVDHRIPAWDVTASVPKGVTMALERGDSRIQAAIWESLREAMAMLEAYAATRVRVDGKQEDRVTGNLVWYAVEHPETRPVEDESVPEDHKWRVMPLPDRHIHVVIPNLTFDEVEDKFKAVKFRPIMDIRKFFDRSFDTILAGKLANGLGYELETKWKDNGKYHSWDIKGIPEAVITRNSQRSVEIDELEASIAAERMEAAKAAGNPGWDTLPGHLSSVEKDKLGATSRLHKRDDLTLADCREYWSSLISEADGRTIAETIERAMLGLNPQPENTVARAVDFALRHHSEQESCIRWEELAATAMERSIGSATPADIEREAKRQGVRIAMIDGRRMATTPELQAEERSISDFAAGGRGSVLPVGGASSLTRTLADGKRLNDGQYQTACGLLESDCRVNLVEGPAGAGKTSMLAKFDEGVRQAGQSVTYLATTAKAAGVLQGDGFDAHTLAHFLLDERMQGRAKGGRVVVDEVSMMGHKDAYRLVTLAAKLDLKLVLVGDPMQHGSVGRGAVMRLLKDYGGIRPFRLSEIIRQKHAEDARYLTAATQLSEGKSAEGFDTLDAMGWVREIFDSTDRYRHIAADYVQSLEDGKSCLVVSPTHAEGARITHEIRSQLRDAGKLGVDREFTKLVAADASEAEKGETAAYRPGDVLVFNQHAKGFKKGQRVTVTDPAAVPVQFADRFSLYRPEKTMLADGDVLRFTGTVKSIDGKHTLKNGMSKSIAGFPDDGKIQLDNGWVIAADAGHFRHGYVETSFGSQGSTVQRAILAMSSASLPATNQEQMYVSSSRAKERMTLYTDSKEDVREAVQRSSKKLLASDMPADKPAQARDRQHRQHDQKRRLSVIDRVRAAWNRLVPHPHKEIHQRKEASHGYER
jgi:conjugative relaxase-like TrwC/TraI family protein